MEDIGGRAMVLLSAHRQGEKKCGEKKGEVNVDAIGPDLLACGKRRQIVGSTPITGYLKIRLSQAPG